MKTTDFDDQLGTKPRPTFLQELGDLVFTFLWAWPLSFAAYVIITAMRAAT